MPNNITPLEPELVRPVDNNIRPLPTLVESPLNTNTEPLVPDRDVPEDNTIEPVPTLVPEPLATNTEPLPPDIDVPEDNTIEPLTPTLNAFAVCNVSDPVEEDTPPPLDTVTLPPV